jgi:5-methylthioadenosine/S-adenosylhomocysteine deaminase
VTTSRYLADYVLTCNADFSLLKNAALDVADGRISWVGEQAEAPPHEGSTIQLGGLLMPGLVNSHAHTPMTLVRGAGDGLPLMDWLTKVMWPREGQMTSEDALWGMRLGAAEMLLSGVTSTCEMYLFEEALVEASQDVGIRLVMTPGIISALHGDSFGATDNRIAAIADFHAQHHDPDTLVTVGFGPHSAYDLPLELCSEVASAARDLDALLHIHVCETKDEGADLEAQHGGKSTIELLAQHEILDGKVLAAHSVWLSETDMEIYAQKGVRVAHCPVSNMKLASGTAAIQAMRAKGIDVGLGTDGPASNDDLDLWQEIKISPLLARVTELDASSMTPQDALTMATVEGSRAIGNDDSGTLQIGAKADFIRLELDTPTFVPVTNDDELIAHVAWSGSGRHVTDVWVQGTQVVANRRLTNFDLERAIAEIQTRGLRLAEDSAT